jgi:tRNA (guanine37-N1)-methyltransferase
VLIDAIVRHIPGALGNEQSILDESHTGKLLEYPQYTRPPIFMDMEVPPVLLSGNHEEIRKWRRREAIRKTFFKRPDLLDVFEPNDEDRKLLRQTMEDIPE